LIVVVMILNLLAMWFAKRILVGFTVMVLQVLGAVLATTNVHHAIHLVVASSMPRVRCANGPSTFSGPSIMKKNVNISAGPTIVSPQRFSN